MMVCCAMIAAMLASLVWCFRRLVPGKLAAARAPLQWRLDGAGAAVKRGGFSIRARAASFGYAFAGLKQVVKTEHNAWVHLMASVVVIALGMYLQIGRDDWTWLILAIGWVISAEVMNTAVEQVCDAVSPEFNREIGAAKDIAAGAVLISAVGAALIGMVRFAPYILDFVAGDPMTSSWCRG